MLKKFLALTLCIVTCLLTSILYACNKTDVINVYAVDGAPVLSVCNLMDKTEINGVEIKVNVVKDVDALKGAIGRKEADVAVCPINVASALYNGGVDYKLLSVNVFGVLKIVGKNQTDLNGLKGKTVYNIGLGGTPDVTLKYVLTANGIGYTENLQTPEVDKVNLKFVASADELIPLLKTGVAEYGVLGEPAVTMASIKAGVSSIISLTDEWKKLHNYEYTQAGITVSNELVKSNPKLVKALFNELKNNYDYCVLNSNNLKNLITKNGSSLQIDFNKSVIDACNINCVNAYDLKNDIEKYLTVLKNYNDKSIGGKLPNNDFYIDDEKL